MLICSVTDRGERAWPLKSWFNLWRLFIVVLFWFFLSSLLTLKAKLQSIFWETFFLPHLIFFNSGPEEYSKWAKAKGFSSKLMMLLLAAWMRENNVMLCAALARPMYEGGECILEVALDTLWTGFVGRDSVRTRCWWRGRRSSPSPWPSKYFDFDLITFNGMLVVVVDCSMALSIMEAARCRRWTFTRVKRTVANEVFFFFFHFQILALKDKGKLV